MKNLLGLTGGFFKEPTKEKWQAAVAAGLTEVEIGFDWQLPDDEACKKAAKNYMLLVESGANVSSCHLPFGNLHDISTLDEPSCLVAMEYMKRLLDWSASKNINIAVIHASFEPIKDDERPLRLAKAAKSIKELGEYAKERNIALAVENLPRTCLGNCASDMLALCKNGESASMCFDVNHLLIESHRDFYGKVAPYVITTHISDYDKLDEKHWFLGEGAIDWAELAGLFEKYDYAGRYIFELNETSSPNLNRAFSPLELVERFEYLTKNGR
ncbi:MAG: sugar phosphate isomerase/epimerase [Oscillospiraceae bacterium]|nr:sugar phosphate isomerase/epimerase [Oscillospiraceae bacterium]